MIAVFVCLVPILLIFAALGALDQRFPGRLSRRGRFLAGLPEVAPARPEPRYFKLSGERGLPKSARFSLAVEPRASTRFR